MKWFRFYAGALEDPQIQSLRPTLFKAYVNLYCLAARQEQHPGTLPALPAIAHALRLRQKEAQAILGELVAANLLDGGTGGQPYRIYAWEDEQKPSDNIAARVAKSRAKKRAQSPDVTLPVTLQDRYNDPQGGGQVLCENSPQILAKPAVIPSQNGQNVTLPKRYSSVTGNGTPSRAHHAGASVSPNTYVLGDTETITNTSSVNVVQASEQISEVCSVGSDPFIPDTPPKYGTLTERTRELQRAWAIKVLKAPGREHWQAHLDAILNDKDPVDRVAYANAILNTWLSKPEKAPKNPDAITTTTTSSGSALAVIPAAAAGAVGALTVAAAGVKPGGYAAQNAAGADAYAEKLIQQFEASSAAGG